MIPSDGEIIEGVASVNESAITGESAPVIREAGGDRSAVTGGTQVLSDWIVVRVTAAPGQTFIDRMIALVEGAERQKTPNEIALDVLLAGLTLIFVIVVVTIVGLASYAGAQVSVTTLVALFVTLIPTTIGGLLSAIGIAGMDRLVRFNVIATSGRAVEAAGDVDTLLLDKTGTITFGNRMADELVPVAGVSQRELAEAALLSSLADQTPEGRSIVEFVATKVGIKTPDLAGKKVEFVAFTAQTRISGADIDGVHYRKGAVDSILDEHRRDRACRLHRGRRAHRAHRRHAACGRQGQAAARRHPPQGHREARHQGALQRASRHGHQDRDGDRRQPHHRRGYRRRGGRRRVHRRGDARGQAQLHPQGASRRAPRRHVRRRHQRRAGARPSRRRHRTAVRHAGRARSRQHGRPRLEPRRSSSRSSKSASKC